MIKSGDTIGICAPSGSFDRKLFEEGLKVLKDMGFNPLVPEDIYQKKRYLAGNDSTRSEIINRFFADKDIKGIMCARGGYGAIRTLDLLDWDMIQKNPKVFIGFSDVTALLVNLAKLPLMEVIHGPNITSLAKAARVTKDSLYRLLTTGLAQTEGLNSDSLAVLSKGSGTGNLTGGNLATLNHLIGTKYQPDFKDCILFIEDVGESPYKIDRMLTQMKMAGCFAGIQGVLTGSFHDCGNLEMIQEIIEETFEEYKVPVITGIESGHGSINCSLPFGKNVKIMPKHPLINWDL